MHDAHYKIRFANHYIPNGFVSKPKLFAANYQLLILSKRRCSAVHRVVLIIDDNVNYTL